MPNYNCDPDDARQLWLDHEAGMLLADDPHDLDWLEAAYMERLLVAVLGSADYAQLRADAAYACVEEHAARIKAERAERVAEALIEDIR